MLEDIAEDKWLDKVSNQQDLQRIERKKRLLNNILSEKGNCIGHILR